MKRLVIAIFSVFVLCLTVGCAADAQAAAEAPAATTAVETVPVYRLYNESTREHLLTLDENEHNVNVGLGWKDEGIAWQAPKSSDTPVWRLYNESSQEHLYTKDANEYRVQTGNGWKDEGTAWYSADESGVPVYRLFNPYEVGIASHLYTQDANEYRTLGSQGWNQENVAWSGVAPNSSTTPDVPIQPEEPDEGSKVLVAYFSCTGTTKGIAEDIAEAMSATLFQIEPQDPYTEADLDYYSGGRADQEQADPSARPAIANRVDDMADYDIVFLGYPIWHGQAPRIISTFLESYDFAGKTIVPFCTSGSSPIGSSAANLHSLAPNATWLDGRRFGAGTPASEVASWVEGFDLPVRSGDEPTESQVGVFDFDTKSVLLNSGYRMPINGLGTYSLTGDVAYDSVSAALERGVRLIDTAYMYGNEEEIGRAVRDSGVPREDVFVITKLYPTQYGDPEAAIQQALDKLEIGYIDLLLLHHPGTGDVEAYKAMERAVKDGKVHSIGLSNWYVEELEDFLPQVDTVPALVQNEIHPYYQENDVIPYIQGKGIVVQGWYPLGGRGHTAELLGDPTINAIADAHGVSAAQVILRWNLQKGVVVIPGSSNPDHIQENTELYDFSLTDDEMARMNALDRGEKHDWY